jgi:hypothetical protein
LLTPQWAVDRAKELTVSNIQRLHSMGITIIGDIDGTAKADVPTGVNEPISSLPLDFAAELLLLHKQESILLDASGKQIRAEFFRRLNSKDPSFLKSLVTKILKKLAK